MGGPLFYMLRGWGEPIRELSSPTCHVPLSQSESLQGKHILDRISVRLQLLSLLPAGRQAAARTAHQEVKHDADTVTSWSCDQATIWTEDELLKWSE